MNHQNNPNPEKRNTNLLLLLSFSLWSISLVMPAFYTYHDTWFGIAILVIGIPLGWGGAGIAGFAVYANIFYGYAFLKLRKNKKPYISIIFMLFLAFLAVFLKKVLISEIPSYTPLISWGWGSIIWAMSLITLACAAWLPDNLKSKPVTLLSLLSLFTITIIALLLYKSSQYRQANEDERKYLPAGAAFTTIEFSHLPYLPPPQNLPITRDTVFELEGNLIESNETMCLQIDNKPDKSNYVYDLPKSFQYDKYFWQYIFGRSFTLYLLEPRKPADYRYRVQLTKPDQFEHILTDAHTNKVLWQAPVKFQSTYDKYPDYDLAPLFKPKETNETSSKETDFEEEVFDQECPYQPYTVDPNINNAIQWQGHIMKMVSNGRYPQTFANYPYAYCSKHYALLIRIPSFREGVLRFQAMMFDKKTLAFKKDFTFYGKYYEPPYSPALEKNIMDYERLTNNGESMPEIDLLHIKLANHVPQPCANRIDREQGKDCSRTALLVPTNRGTLEAH